MQTTLFQLETYLNKRNKSLFDNLTLPESIDKENLTDNILIQLGDYEPLYADADFLKFAIGNWGKKWYNTFDRWAKALVLEYNPIENYNRTEHTSGTLHEVKDKTETVSDETKFGKTITNGNAEQDWDYEESHSTKHSDRNGGYYNSDGTWVEDELTSTHVYGDGENGVVDELNKHGIEYSKSEKVVTENEVSAYDDSDLVTQSKVTVTASPDNAEPNNDFAIHTFDDDFGETNTRTGQESDTTSGSKAFTDDNDVKIKDRRKSEEGGAETHDYTRSTNYKDGTDIWNTVTGNVGVTTSQQMVEAELELYRFNLINEITNIFAQELVITVS